MTRVLWPLLALSLLIPMPSPAQDSEAEVRTEATSDSPILRAMLLPLLAQEARAAGMPEEDLLLLLTESQRHQIPAERAGELLEESTKALRENGPVDNFGAFVACCAISDRISPRDCAVVSWPMPSTSSIVPEARTL